MKTAKPTKANTPPAIDNIIVDTGGGTLSIKKKQKNGVLVPVKYQSLNIYVT